MPNFVKINGIALSSIVKFAGVAKTSLAKMIGLTNPDAGGGGDGGGGAGSGGLEENAGASFFGNASLTDGVLQLDGSGDYVKLASSTDYDRGSGDMTIEVWFNAAQLPSSNNNFGIVSKSTGQHAWNGWVLTLSTQSQDGGGTMTNGGIGVYNSSAGGGSNRNNRKAPSGGVSTNEWHYVALVMDADDVYRIYFDGQQIHTFTPVSRSTTTSADLVIGGLKTSGIINTFNGQIDGVKITKSVLTAQTILNTYNAGR